MSSSTSVNDYPFRQIIGLCGPIGAGKSAVASMLMVRGFKRVRFAGPLKDMMKALGLSAEEIDGSLKEKPCELLGGRTPRHAMQTIGTEWGRDLIHPGLWVSAWKRRIPAGEHIVADDVRFQNEADTIRGLGGVIIGLKRPGVQATAHVSESGVQPDLTLENSGSLDDLEREVSQLMVTLSWVTR
jgi:hypothetical protein